MDQSQKNRVQRYYPLTLLAACMLLSGCGDSSNDNNSSSPTPTPSTRSITVTPSLGQINNADVILKQLSTGTTLGTLNTGTSGTVTFSNIAANSGALAIEVKPTSTSTYFDEATAQNAPLTQSLNAFAELSGNANVGVTAWTEAAYRRALALAGSAKPSSAQIQQATTEMSTQAGLNILTAPTLVDSTADLNALKGSLADAYALSLAALAEQASLKLGSGETAPALKTALDLAADAVDGKIDGKGLAGANIANLSYNADSFLADFISQINSLISSLNLPTGANGIGSFVQPKAPTVTPPPTSTGLTLTGSETGTFSPATSSTKLESGETVYRFATANNAASIAVYVKANGSVRLANFIDSNSAYECFEATCRGISIANGKVMFDKVTLDNGLNISGSLTAATLTPVPPVPPVTPTLPVSVDGLLSVNGTNQAISSASYNETNGGAFLIKQLSMTTAAGQFIFNMNGTADLSVSAIVGDASLPALERIYSCATNCGVLTVTDGFAVINTNGVVLKNNATGKTITLANSIVVERTTGSMTTDSATLGNFTPVTSSISQKAENFELLFSTLGTAAQSGTSLVTVLFNPSTRAVVEVSVVGGIGGSVYKCFANGAGIGIPACSGFTVAANNRTVTFNNAKVAGGAAFATPTTVTLNGTLTAVR